MNDPERAISDSVVRFAWPVAAAGYRWSSEHQLWTTQMSGIPAAVRAAPGGPWLIDPGSGGESYEGRITHPLRQQHGLHVEFAQLPLGSDPKQLEQIAAFASHHGLLGIEGQLVRTVPEANPDKRLVWAEHLASWQRAIRQMGLLVELANAYRANESELLRRYVRWFAQGRGVRIEYTAPGDERPSRIPILRDIPTLSDSERAQLRSWSHSDDDRGRYLEPVAYFLNRELNELIAEHVVPRVPLGGDIELRPDSLFGAMVVLLVEQLSGSWQMKRCKNCGRLFVPRYRRDQETCSTACRKRWSRAHPAAGKEKP